MAIDQKAPAQPGRPNPNPSLFATGSASKAVFILIIVTAIIRLIGAGAIDLGLGEAYYLATARQLHLGYFDQPPLALWMLWATNKLFFFTEDPVFLRIPFILMFSGSTWVLYRLGARYRSEWTGFLAAFLLNASILFTLSIGSWLQPDAPLMLFWLLTCWALTDIFFGPETGSPYKKWAWAGLWLGLTFLTKYHAIFLVVGTGLFMLTNARARRWFLHPAPYVAVVIAAVIFSPVILWNAQNDWASFGFQGGRALGTDLHIDWFLRMVIGQIVYVTPWICLPALVAGALALSKGPKGEFPEDTASGFGWFTAMMGVPIIIFFTLVSAWTDTQFHFHWQAAGYMMLFLTLGAWTDAAWRKHRTFILSWLSIAAVINFLIFAVLVSHASTGWLRYVLPGGQTFEDPTSQVLEWRNLRTWYDNANIDPNSAFVAGLDWTECGFVDNPLEGKLPLACLSADPRNIAFNINLADMVGRDTYFVTRYADFDHISKQFAPFYDSFEPVEQFDVVRSGRVEISNITIVKGTNFHMSRQIAASDKSETDVLMLPRTKIASISGQIKNEGPQRTVELWVDKHLVGHIELAAKQTTTFTQDIDNPRWAVGMRDSRVHLREVGGGDEGLKFGQLEVTIK